MPHERCKQQMPDHAGYMAKGYPDERPRCLLADGHKGMHLVRFSSGICMEWRPKPACDSPPKETLGEKECAPFIHEEVHFRYARERLKEEVRRLFARRLDEKKGPA